MNQISASALYHGIISPGMGVVGGVIALIAAFRGGMPESVLVAGVALITVFLVIPAVVRVGCPLVDAFIGDSKLLLVDRKRRVVVPFTSIKRVYSRRWLSDTITVVFAERTQLGGRVCFVPSWDFHPFRPHPILLRLKKAVEAANQTPDRTRLARPEISGNHPRA